MPRGWLATLAGVLAVAALLGWAALSLRQGGSNDQAIFANTLKKGEVAAAMRIGLLRAVEAEKSAVLADTDEASQDYANQARQATAEVQAQYQQMQRLLAAEPNLEEAKLLKEFELAWAEFVRVDKEILELAVLNTNLKAASLSQGQVRQAVEEMEQALERLLQAQAGSPQILTLTRLAGQARAAALKIWALQAPHINELSDQGMDRLEAEMVALDARLRQGLDGLAELLAEAQPGQAQAGGPDLAAARQAYQRFRDLGQEVIRLSRLNSNLKSLELSLGQKRKVAALCQEILSALQESIQSRAFKATR